MAGILVGDKECPIQDIVKVFGSPFMATVTILKWRSFARRLHTPSHIVKKHQLDLQLDKVTHFDVIEELLLEWRSRTSEKATLGELLKLVLEHFQWQELIDFLQSKIRKYAENWRDLDTNSQDLILNSMIIFQGKERTLKSFSSQLPKHIFNNILQDTLNTELFFHFFQKQSLQLDTFVSKHQVPYYIQRNLTSQRYLNPKIFAVDSEDIFVFDNIQHHQLTNLVQPQSTDVSGNQVNELSVRFVLLELDEDLEAITKTTKHPLHRIKYSNNKFIWVGSYGSLRLIRSFLIDDYEKLSESTFVSEKLSMFNNRPTLLSSSPGMGKSVLLSNLAIEVKKQFPERVVLVMELGNLFSSNNFKGKEIDLVFVEHTLTTAVSHNILGKRIIYELINNNICFELFLDGFDEIPFDMIEKANQFVKYLLGCQNLRIFITSRPHLRSGLEDALECISYNLSPFSQEDQIRFLSNYWKIMMDVKDHKTFANIAKTILKSLKPLDGKDSGIEFAGIPLQCYMLAQVYSNDVRRYANRNFVNEYELLNRTKSLYDLYVHFMEFKLQNCQEELQRYLLKIFHWNEALHVLFPENHYVLIIRQALDEILKGSSLAEEKVLAVGILEKHNKSLNFVHRTFAEYLVSEFVVQNATLSPLVNINVLSEFIYETILDVRFSNRGVTVRDCFAEILMSSLNTSFQRDYQSLKKLAGMLLCKSKVLNLYEKLELKDILDFWIKQSGASATLDAFLRALISIGWKEAADNLANSELRGKLELQHPTICMFANEHLAKLKTTLSVYNKENFTMNHSSPNAATSFIYRTSTCVCFDYKYLIQLLVKICTDNVELVSFVHMSKKTGHDFILYAARCNDVEFFEYCCDVVKIVADLKFPNIKFWINQLNDVEFEHTPLHEAVVHGNYRLVEYLINVYEPNLEILQNVWQVCLFKSNINSKLVLKSKVKILFLLESINLLNDLDEIDSKFPTSVHVELFTAFCDIVGYVPHIENVECVARKVLAGISCYSEMDILVHWFLSKNIIEHFLVLFDGKRSILDYALSYDLLSLKSLEKIYKALTFNMGNVLTVTIMYLRGEELVQAVVELTGDVNLIDSSGQSLLQKAACLRDVNLIRYLLSAGAEVNHMDNDGNISLHYVFFGNQISKTNIFIHDCVEILLENNADINAKANNEVTPYSYALLHKEKMNIEDRTIDLIKKEMHLSKNPIVQYRREDVRKYAVNDTHEENRKTTRCIVV